MPIDHKQIRRLSELASIKLDEQEERAYAEDLGPVVAMMERLNEVDATGVPAMSHVFDLQNVMREDEVEERWSEKEALKQVVDTDEGFVRVPRLRE